MHAISANNSSWLALIDRLFLGYHWLMIDISKTSYVVMWSFMFAVSCSVEHVSPIDLIFDERDLRLGMVDAISVLSRYLVACRHQESSSRLPSS